MGTRAVPLQYVCRYCGANRETRRAGKPPVYCDRACRAADLRKGRSAPARYRQAGYWRLRWNEGGRYVSCFEHRLVWEEANGPIPDGFVVHHINGDKGDNRIENLCLMRRGEHGALHNRQPDVYPERGTPSDYTRKWKERHPEYKAIHAQRERERRARRREMAE